ncbi:protein SLOW GREEN 1, chloroplastic [Linum perenne]
MEEALKIYDQLSKEDPEDFRPYFCKGMIYSLLNRNEEAEEQLAKYRELSPVKVELGDYLKTPLSQAMVFGSNDSN